MHDLTNRMAFFKGVSSSTGAGPSGFPSRLPFPPFPPLPPFAGFPAFGRFAGVGGDREQPAKIADVAQLRCRHAVEVQEATSAD